MNKETSLEAMGAFGRSKIAFEEIITSCCFKHGIKLIILRLPLIAGLNPPGNLADMIRAIYKSRFPLIDNGTAKRSLVLDRGIPLFVEKIKDIGGICHLTDGYDPSFMELATVLKRPSQVKLISIPLNLAKLMAYMGDLISRIASRESAITTRKLNKMTTNLTFSYEKAQRAVDWKPSSVINL